MNDNILGLSDRHDSAHHHDSIGLFTMMILYLVSSLTI